MKTRNILAIGILVALPVVIALGVLKLRGRGEYRQTGKTGGEWGNGIPVKIDAAAMQRGRELYLAHGASAHGQDGTKTADNTPSLLATHARQMKDGEIFGLISKGKGKMPGFAKTLSIGDRWKLVAYVRALQRQEDPQTGDRISIQEAMSREVEALKSAGQAPPPSAPPSSQQEKLPCCM